MSLFQDNAPVDVIEILYLKDECVGESYDRTSVVPSTDGNKVYEENSNWGHSAKQMTLR